MIFAGGPPLEEHLALSVEYEDGERTMQLASVAMCFELAFKSDRPIEFINQDNLFRVLVVHRLSGRPDKAPAHAALLLLSRR